jgi:porin
MKLHSSTLSQTLCIKVTQLILLSVCTSFLSAEPVNTNGQIEGDTASGDKSVPYVNNYPQENFLTGDWGGGRSKLHEAGIDLRLSYTAEPAALLSGGYDEGSSTYLHNINLEFKADLEKLAGWRNSTFLAKFSSRHGDNLSELYVAPGSTPDGAYIYGEYFNKSQEVYGGQTTKLVNFQLTTQLHEKVSIDVGRLVMNDFFLRSDIYCDFMSNATCGAPKGIFTPYALSAYPDATMGIHTNIEISEDLHLHAAIFDGGWTKQDPNGFDWELGLNGVAYTGELQYILQGGSTYGEKRVIKVGVNHHTGDFNNFKTGEIESGNTSYYILADIGIYSEDKGGDQGLSLFGSYVYNENDEIAGLTNFYNIGMVYKGLIPGRDIDKLGVNFVYAKHSEFNTYTHDHISGLIRGDESILEISYNYYLPYGIQLMPDFQYIKHPNGSVDFDDAVIVGLKFNVNF